MGILQFIFELEQLPNETLDGVECLHYSGVPRFGNIPCEIWIGKNDYFIRQVINRYEDDRLIQTFITKYYDFNEDIDIQPPVDSSGSLLSGWETESIESAFFLVPVYDTIADIDENADWSNPDVVLEALAMIGSVTEPYTYYQALPEEGQQAIMDFLKSVMAGSVGEIKITTTIISDGKTTVISDGQTTIIK